MTLYGSLIAVQSITVFGFIYICGLLGEQVRYDLRKGMFAHLQNLSLSYYNKTPVGWIISRVSSDSERVSELVTWGQLDIVWSTMNILTSIYYGQDQPAVGWHCHPDCASDHLHCLLVSTAHSGGISRVRKRNSKITGTYNENITGVRDQGVESRRDQSGQVWRTFGRDVSGKLPLPGFGTLLPSVQLLSTLAIAAIV